MFYKKKKTFCDTEEISLMILFFRYVMFLLGNKFYIFFITLWIFGIYYIFTTFHSTTNNDKIFEDRIEYLQNEVESLRQKISQLHSEK
jgi:hypothetical protein